MSTLAMGAAVVLLIALLAGSYFWYSGPLVIDAEEKEHLREQTSTEIEKEVAEEEAEFQKEVKKEETDFYSHG